MHPRRHHERQLAHLRGVAPCRRPQYVYVLHPSISVGPEHQAAGGEVPNMSVELDNARGQHTRLFARPPLGATATLADTTGATLFAGRVQSVTCSGTITVELEA